MIDVHTHILPGLDDGAQNWDEAMEMAFLAVEGGTDTVVATVHSERPGPPSQRLLGEYFKCLQAFRQRLEREQIPLRVLPGMEIYAQGDLSQRLDEGEVIGLNGSCHVLVEFHPETPWTNINRDIEQLHLSGYSPVVAHPERYRCVAEDLQCILDWRELGASIQLNKGSIQGRFGREIAEVAHGILFRGWSDVVASDAHGVTRRTPDLHRIQRDLLQKVGATYARTLLDENPRRIVCGAIIK